MLHSCIFLTIPNWSQRKNVCGTRKKLKLLSSAAINFDTSSPIKVSVTTHEHFIPPILFGKATYSTPPVKFLPSSGSKMRNEIDFGSYSKFHSKVSAHVAATDAAANVEEAYIDNISYCHL